VNRNGVPAISLRKRGVYQLIPTAHSVTHILHVYIFDIQRTVHCDIFL